jgi:exonuclease SbcD
LSGEDGKGPFVAYSGSLLKYSFAEAGEEKSLSLVEVDGQGRVSLERAPLVPRRDARVLSGPLEEVLARAHEDRARDDYVKVVLEDKEPVLDAMARLRLAYPNVLHVEQPRWLSSSLLDGPALEDAALEGRELRAEPLFERFFEEVTGEPLGEEERRCLEEALADHAARRRERAA